MPRGNKDPMFVRCEGCGHNLQIDKYQFGFPAHDVSDERVSWSVVHQGAQTYQLLCSCGHYTVAAFFARSTDGS